MRTPLASLLVLPALIAFAAPGGDVTFGPEDGFVLTKTYESASEMTLDDMSVSMNGQEQDPSMVSMEQTITNSTKVVVTDEYAKVDGGRPLQLQRTFDTIESGVSMEMSHPMMGDMDMDMPGSSELEGQTVTFTWNEEEGEYAIAFDEDSGGDEELLEDLVEDTDLRAFLPAGEVSEGDTWEIDAAEMKGILAFGGALKIEYDDSDIGDFGGLGSGPSPTPDQFLGDIEGSVAGEYLGTREEDGVTVAAIKIVCEISSAKDLTELFADSMGGEMPEGMDMEQEIESADFEYEYEGEGLLLWNLEAGHMHSFELSGDGVTTIDMAMSMSMQGMDMDIEISMVMSGDDSSTITTSSGGE